MWRQKLCLMPFSVSSVPDFLPDIEKIMDTFLTKLKIIIMEVKEDKYKEFQKERTGKRQIWDEKITQRLSGKIDNIIKLK